MQFIAEALRRKGYCATSVSYYESKFGHVNDVSFGFKSGQDYPKRAVKMFLFFLWASSVYDVFHFFYGESLLPRNADLPILKAMGKKTVMHFRGSDCINPYYIAWRARGDDVQQKPRISRPRQVRKVRFIDRYCNELLISTPDLAKAVPRSTLVQQAIDLRQWECTMPQVKSKNETVRIVHAPTKRWKKGTDFIVKAVEELKCEGYDVTLRIVEDVPHSEVKRIYQQADIAVDNVIQGCYCKVSIEMMALGKPVICSIDEEFKDVRPDLPIVSANPRTLTEKLRWLIENSDLRLELGLKGREYVEKYHDVDRIADQLIELYQRL